MPSEPRAAAAVARSTLRLGLALVLVAGVLAVLPRSTAAAAPTLPAGFVVQDLPSGQDATLSDFAFAPDGSWFTTGKAGRVAWVSPAGVPRTLAQLTVVDQQDLGLTGIAVAADYATSRQIYTARTLLVDGDWATRLSAWTVTGSPEPTGLTGERVVLELPQNVDVHALTGIVAAPDGTLWVTVGDAADFRVQDPLALRALDLDQGYGKVLHVLPDGSGVASNPYYDAAAPQSWRSRVYASGFRSPFRLALDPVTGAPIVGDVGWNTWEEVDLVRPGASYGWPCWEGNAPTPGYADLPECQGAPNTAPLWTYPHGPLGSSVTGGVVYPGSDYPEEYRGAYFFGDFTAQRVYTLRHDAAGRLVREPEAAGFAVEHGRPVRFGTAANGDIVYADLVGLTLKRLVHRPGAAPTVIDGRYAADPALQALLGPPTGAETADGPVSYRTYEFGRLYWSATAGVHVVHRGILATYLGLGGHTTLGEPTTDELPTPDGRGRFNHFRLDASVYWTPGTGAHAVYGAVRGRWAATGWELGPHGYPRSSELATPDGRGRYNDFENGGIYWLPSAGAHGVYGAIYAAWAGLGWEGGQLGFPLTDEAGTPDGIGRFTHFERGSIYWTPRTGAHPVYGAIHARWRALGWELSYLGYPTSDEYTSGTGRRMDFERGYITWDATTGAVADRPY